MGVTRSFLVSHLLSTFFVLFIFLSCRFLASYHYRARSRPINEFPNPGNLLDLSPLDRDNPAAYKIWPQSSIRDSRFYLYYVPYTPIVYFQTCRSAARPPSFASFLTAQETQILDAPPVLIPQFLP